MSGLSGAPKYCTNNKQASGHAEFATRGEREIYNKICAGHELLMAFLVD